MAITLGQTAIWILEALKEEKRREPDFEKCKTAVEIFTPMRDKHCLCDADITEAVTFLCRQGFADVILFPRGKVVRILNRGGEYLDAHKAAQAEKRKWKRSEKIALGLFSFYQSSHFSLVFTSGSNPRRNQIVRRQQGQGQTQQQQHYPNRR